MHRINQLYSKSVVIFVQSKFSSYSRIDCCSIELSVLSYSKIVWLREKHTQINTNAEDSSYISDWRFVE